MARISFSNYLSNELFPLEGSEFSSAKQAPPERLMKQAWVLGLPEGGSPGFYKEPSTVPTDRGGIPREQGLPAHQSVTHHKPLRYKRKLEPQEHKDQMSTMPRGTQSGNSKGLQLDRGKEGCWVQITPPNTPCKPRNKVGPVSPVPGPQQPLGGHKHALVEQEK